MKIKVLSMGRIRQDFILKGEAEYVKRLKSFGKISFLELDTERFGSLSEAEQKEREAELLARNCTGRDYLIVLDERGKSFTSPQFAEWLGKKMSAGESSFVFAIGGPFGWSERVRKSARMVFSLSALTFPYQLTRLVLVEQLYRASSILGGAPYHK